jgi:ribosomal protein L11 methyltransferase
MVKPDFGPRTPLDTLEDLILHHIHSADRRLPAWAVEQFALEKSTHPGPTRKVIRKAIKHLVEKGALDYCYEHGCSFLEPSFNKPVRITKRIILKPPDVKGFGQPGDRAIQLMPGASFGTGRHPTTRLSLKGIEFALQGFRPMALGRATKCLDIGTGSGVLAIASVGLGIHTAVGIDQDACARNEARQNIRINGLSDCIRISSKSFEELEERFDLITANLRYPTLMDLLPRMAGGVASGGRVVVSGIYDHEAVPLTQAARVHGLASIWRGKEKRWAGLVLEKAKGREGV